MATLSTPRLLRAADYAELDEIPGFHDELIEGEHVVSPSPKLSHGHVVEKLERIIGQQLTAIAEAAGMSGIQLLVEREQGWVFQTANQIDSVIEPDLMVVREIDARRALKADSWFQGIPVMIVEVVSSSERKSRRLQKVGLYLDMGVRHIVEVDYRRKVVLVYSPDSDAPTTYGIDQQIAVPFQASVHEMVAVLDELDSRSSL